MTAQAPDHSPFFSPLLFHLIDQGWSKDPKVLAALRSSQQDESFGIHGWSCSGSGKNQIISRSASLMSPSLKDRTFSDPASIAFGRLTELNDKFLALPLDGVVPDDRNDHPG